MLRVVSIVLVLVAAAGYAGSQEAKDLHAVEHWRCYSIFDFGKEKILVEALRFEVLKDRLPLMPSAAPGVIKVAGMAYQALFYVEGFDRTWTFGPAEELIADTTTTFTFVVNPDGSGFYYDFSGVDKGESAKPSQRYECVVSGPQEPAGETGADGTRTGAGGGKPCGQRPEVAGYINRVKSRVLSRWKGSGGGEVELEFSIDAAGTASNVNFVSAPDPVVGAAIVEAMRVASPFEPMSESVRGCLAGDTMIATFTLTRE